MPNYNSHFTPTPGGGRHSTTANDPKSTADRLYGRLATLKRECEEWQQKSELSSKRLSLARQDKNGVEKDVRDKQEELAALKARATGGAAADINGLRKTVHELQQRANYQHADLVGKREKIATIQKTTQQDEMLRDKALRSGNEKMRQVRKKLDAVNINKKNSHDKKCRGGEMNPETSLEFLKSEMNGFDGERLWKNWPHIVEQKAASVQKEADELRRSSEELARILEGYKRHFGLEIQSPDALEVLKDLSTIDECDDQEIEDANY